MKDYISKNLIVIDINSTIEEVAGIMKKYADSKNKKKSK